MAGPACPHALITPDAGRRLRNASRNPSSARPDTRAAQQIAPRRDSDGNRDPGGSDPGVTPSGRAEAPRKSKVAAALACRPLRPPDDAGLHRLAGETFREEAELLEDRLFGQKSGEK